MGPVVTSQKLSRTFYFYNKQKHQLVLRRTSWCFVLLWPRHVFTKYFARIRDQADLVWSDLAQNFSDFVVGSDGTVS